MTRREVPKWWLYTQLGILLALLAGILWSWSYVSSHTKHPMDCTKVRESFYHYLGEATFDQYAGVKAASDRDQKIAVKIVLTTPYCFPQGLIEVAQQNM